MNDAPQSSSSGTAIARPCPFCGLPPLKTRAVETFIIHCGNPDCEAKCEITGASPEYVIAAWNSRILDPALGQSDRAATPQEVQEACALVADRTAKRCVREGIPGDSVAEFIAKAIRALIPPAASPPAALPAGEDMAKIIESKMFQVPSTGTHAYHQTRVKELAAEAVEAIRLRASSMPSREGK